MNVVTPDGFDTPEAAALVLNEEARQQRSPCLLRWFRADGLENPLSWRIKSRFWLQTHDGRTVRLLNLIDEHTRESFLVRAERRWPSSKVIEALADVMVMKGVPEHLRSDNGPEFVARDLRKWLANIGAKTLYIEPGTPSVRSCIAWAAVDAAEAADRNHQSVCSLSPN